MAIARGTRLLMVCFVIVVRATELTHKREVHDRIYH